MSVDTRTATRRQAVDAAWHHLRVHRIASHALTPGLIDHELRRVNAYAKALADLKLTGEAPPADQLTL